jgi:endonuclease/exonuclease/phosphatase family metal-dependent hydrolase
MRVAVLALLLGTIAGPARAAEAPAGPPDDDGVSIHVLTFNTWGLAPPFAYSRRTRFPRIDGLVHVDRWDVVGLQEVWWGARHMLHPDRLKLPSGEDDSGLAVLSRWTVGDSRLHVFTRASGFDQFKSKGLLQTELAIPSVGRVLLLDTHLQSGRSEHASAVRSSQIDEILSVVGAVDEPVVLVGDFNLYEDLPLDVASAARLAAGGLQDAALVLGRKEATYRDGSRFDRVFVRSSDRVQLALEDIEPVAGADGLSDHHPLAIGLRARRRIRGALASADPDTSSASPLGEGPRAHRPEKSE